MCLDSRDTPDAVGCRTLLVSQIHDQVDLVVGLYKQLFLLSLALSFIRALSGRRKAPLGKGGAPKARGIGDKDHAPMIRGTDHGCVARFAGYAMVNSTFS